MEFPPAAATLSLLTLMSISATGVLGIGGKAVVTDRLVRARLYRQRAEELRTIAQDYINDATMQALAKVAHDYEDMAEILERAAKRDGLDPGH